MDFKDTYNTLAAPTEEIIFKEKNSKFYGYAFPVLNEEAVKEFLDSLKKKHPNAVHFCYAYQLGTENFSFRANDDGEPSYSAGQPIYGQIQSFKLTNVLIVVVRYFGGVKLGVGGLISAYKTTAQQAIEKASIIEKTINSHFLISFDYTQLNKVMRIIKEKKLEIISQKLEMRCEIEVAIRKKNATNITEVFQKIVQVKIAEATI